MRKAVILASAALALIAMPLVASAAAGTLFIGTDGNSFDGILPDRLGVDTVNGGTVTGQTIYPTSFHLNGLTDVSGQNYLYAGDPFSGVINKVSYTGVLLGSISVPGIATGCCNEDMIWTGTQLYHAQYGNGVQLIDTTTGAVLSTSYQPDIVGMAYVGNQIWISHWGGSQVGIWDPNTNAFTPEFNTPNLAGGLAYDAADGIMWVGLYGGEVIPFNLSGAQQGPGFYPFGNIGDTIDGLAFLGEASQGGSVPEPATWGLMLVGFGGLGVAFRSRRRTATFA